ncbi:MAG: hypothetical protein K5784_11350 [Clostridiales bacterium]|nr:hypothetical protein [Clostridiales bacterium]
MKLDRAFKPTPKAFHDSILIGIQKGEKKVKLLHKIRIATAVAALAACALLVAFAAGNTGAPAPTTQTLLTQGSEDNATTAYYTEVYYTEHGNFYHYDERCSGMENAMMARLEDVVEEGKQPCPICVMHEMDEETLPDITPKTTAMVMPTPTPQPNKASNEQMPITQLVWYTPKGVFYHEDKDCIGMVNAEMHDVTEVVNDGKRPCPVCVSNGKHNCGAKFDELLPGAREYINAKYGVVMAYTAHDIELGEGEGGPLFDQNGSNMWYERYSNGEALSLSFTDGRGEEMLNSVSDNGEDAGFLWEIIKQIRQHVLGKLTDAVNAYGRNEELQESEYYLSRVMVKWRGGDMYTVDLEFSANKSDYRMCFTLEPSEDWRLISARIFEDRG